MNNLPRDVDVLVRVFLSAPLDVRVDEKSTPSHTTSDALNEEHPMPQWTDLTHISRPLEMSVSGSLAGGCYME